MLLLPYLLFVISAIQVKSMMKAYRMDYHRQLYLLDPNAYLVVASSVHHWKVQIQIHQT